MLAQTDAAIVLQMAVFPCLGIIGVLIGVLWRGTLRRLDNAMTATVCEERHRGLTEAVARFESKLDRLCSNGVIGGLREQQARLVARVDALERAAEKQGTPQ